MRHTVEEKPIGEVHPTGQFGHSDSHPRLIVSVEKPAPGVFWPHEVAHLTSGGAYVPFAHLVLLALTRLALGDDEHGQPVVSVGCCHDHIRGQ